MTLVVRLSSWFDVTVSSSVNRSDSILPCISINTNPSYISAAAASLCTWSITSFGIGNIISASLLIFLPECELRN